jgi:hypothetical protein
MVTLITSNNWGEIDEWQNQWASNKPVIPPVNGLKQWDAVYPLLINFSLEWDYIGLRKPGKALLNGTQQSLVYANEGNLLGKK